MKKMSKKNKILLQTIITVLLILLAFGMFSIYELHVKPTKIPSVDELIKEKKKEKYQEKEEKPNIQEYVNILPLARQETGNPDVMGKLQIPDIGIDAWITRAADNEYYLNYNLWRQWDQLGVPFFDFRNYNLNTDRQINIYGHNTTNQSIMDKLPLINIEAYVDEGIFNNYKDVYLSIDERQIHYEVIAVKLVNDWDNEHMKIAFSDDNDFLNHTAKLLQNTMHKRENIDISKDDNLIVLQVCHYNPPGTYLLVIGKEVKV